MRQKESEKEDSRGETCERRLLVKVATGPFPELNETQPLSKTASNSFSFPEVLSQTSTEMNSYQSFMPKVYIIEG